MTDTSYHESVMRQEVVNNLHVKSQAKYIDATLGTGGHTFAIAQKGGVVLGIEMDPEMLSIAEERLSQYKDNVTLVNGNFTQIAEIAKNNNFDKVSGIVFDLGVSNLHLKDVERGFSFANPEAELDMRLNKVSQAVKASDLLNVLRQDQLVNLFNETLEPGQSRWLVGRVVSFRQKRNFEKVGDLLEICQGLRTGKKRLNEATLPFLALRIAVNSELDNLKLVLPKAYALLEEGGNLVIITFHSKEEKIVKDFLGKRSDFVPPSIEEVEKNQRSRSAKMWVIKKL